MTEYVSESTLVVSVQGISALFEAGVPRPLRESLVGAALAAGVKPVGAGQAAPAKTDKAEATVEDVVAAIRELMASGDTKAFGATGEPKLASLKTKTGKAVTDAVRDEAWAIVKAEG